MNSLFALSCSNRDPLTPHPPPPSLPPSLVDAGLEEADQESAKSIQAEGTAGQFLQGEVRRAFPRTSVRTATGERAGGQMGGGGVVVFSYLTNTDGGVTFFFCLFFSLPPFECRRSPREDHSFYKPGSSNQRYHPFDPRADFHRRDHFQHKPPHAAPSERERYEKRESADGSSPSKQNNGEFKSVKTSVTGGGIIHVVKDELIPFILFLKHQICLNGLKKSKYRLWFLTIKVFHLPPKSLLLSLF